MQLSVLQRFQKFRSKMKRVHLTIFRNYILFVLSLFIILVVAFVVFAFQTRNIDSDVYSSSNFGAQALIKNNFNSQAIKNVSRTGGWVEIIDDNRRIVKVYGNKLDKMNAYTLSQFNDFIDGLYEKYNYSVAHFYRSGKGYYALVKIPAKKYILTSMILKVNPTQYTLRVKRAFTHSITLFLVLLLSIAVFYTKWTSKTIVQPLKKILDGINKMNEDIHRDDIKLEFEAPNEFAKIRDAFNNMVRRLQISERERKKMEETRQQMLTDISHDLKTPVTSIQGYSEAIYRGVVTDEEKKNRYLKIIYDKSKRVTELIDNLHSLTKLDNCAYDFKIEKEDFVEFLREIVAEFYEDIENKGFELDMIIPENQVIIGFDRQEMARAISNLITNALKYNDEGTILRIELHEKADAHLVLQIADNGKGIPQELKEKIFEPFTRGDASRQSTGGTGLGLSIARKIIERHDGKLFLTQSLSEATVFVIEL